MNIAFIATIGAIVLFAVTFIALTGYMNHKMRLRKERIDALRAPKPLLKDDVIGIGALEAILEGAFAEGKYVERAASSHTASVYSYAGSLTKNIKTPNFHTSLERHLGTKA